MQNSNKRILIIIGLILTFSLGTAALNQIQINQINQTDGERLSQAVMPLKVIVNVSSNYTIPATVDDVIFYNATSTGSYNVTLPAATNGSVINVHLKSNNGYQLIINSTYNISDAYTLNLSNAGDSVTLLSEGSTWNNWIVI